MVEVDVVVWVVVVQGGGGCTSDGCGGSPGWRWM